MNTPICSRCQLPTEVLWADGRCVECRKALGLPVEGIEAFDDAPVAPPDVLAGAMLTGKIDICSFESMNPSLTADQRERLIRGEWVVLPEPHVVTMDEIYAAWCQGVAKLKMDEVRETIHSLVASGSFRPITSLDAPS